MTFDTRRQQLVAGYQSIFGQNIATAESTISGEMISLHAIVLSDLDDEAQAIHDAFNMDLAVGEDLDNLAALLGLKRKEQTRSQVTLTFVCESNTTIPFQTQVSDENNLATFETTQDANAGASGTVSVVAQATQDGAIAAAPNTITKILTPFVGFQAVTNTAAAIPGEEEEIDEELRARMRASQMVNSVSMVEALLSGLRELDDVRSVKVFENTNASVDSNGVPGHSIHCLVAGGTDQDIASMIWQKKGMGVGTFGAVSKDVVDSQGTTHHVKFDRPVDVAIIVDMSISYDVDEELTQDQILDAIKTKLVNFGRDHLGIGDDAAKFAMICPVLNAVPGVKIESFNIKKSGGSYEDVIAIAYNEMALLSTNNINITVANPS